MTGKRILAALVLAAVLLAALTGAAMAAVTEYSEEHGVEWWYDSYNQTLYIRPGTGVSTRDYSLSGRYSSTYYPWFMGADYIQKLVIEDGIQTVGSYVLQRAPLMQITCASSVRYIHNSAFYSLCRNGTIMFQGPAPEFEAMAMAGVDGTAYYHGADGTWKGKLQNYGGTVTWVDLDASSSCGNGVKWMIRGNNVVLSGAGTVTTRPWANSVTDGEFTITVKNDVTGLGSGVMRGAEIVRFEGGAPAIASDAFSGTTATVYYPVCGSTWTEDKRLNYGGTLTWATLEGTAHTVVQEAEQQPTCLAAGRAAGTRCSVCGEVLSGCEELSALGHDLISVEACAPGCETSGWEAYEACTRCNYTTKGDELPPLGHDVVVTGAVAATATAPGRTEGSHCARCGYVFVQWEELPADPSVLAIGTCGTDVRWQLGADGCLTINGTGAMDDFGGADAAPWYEWRGSIRSIRVETGVTALGAHAFDGCGLTQTVALSASVRRVGPNALNGLAATVTFAGEAPTFDEAAFSNARLSVFYPANDATWSSAVRLNYGGTAEWTVQGVCAHDEAYGVIVDQKEATCTEEGFTGDLVCDLCGAVCRQGEAIELLPHTEVADEAVAPTRTETGLTAGKHCEVCGAVLAAQEPVPVLPAAWDYSAPAALSAIGEEAFLGNAALRGVRLAGNCAAIGSRAFADCPRLQFVCIPNECCAIAEDAFDHPERMVVITVPGSQTAARAKALGMVVADLAAAE